jgi:hypothetical protein
VYAKKIALTKASALKDRLYYLEKMAPKPQFLQYENDDIERVPTFEKKGTCCSFIELLKTLSVVSKSNSAVVIHAILHGTQRISYGTCIIRQWSSRGTKTSHASSPQSNIDFFLARYPKIDRYEARLCRRWLWCVHRNDFEKGLYDIQSNVSLGSCICITL